MSAPPLPTTPCVLWTGRINSFGYGTIGVDLAHRRLWIAAHGPLEPGIELDHLCRVRACVALDHLDPVTRQENIARSDPGRYWREKTHCPYGHPYAGDNLLVSKGRRYCRTCRRTQMQARREARRTPDDPCSRCGQPLDSIKADGRRRYCHGCTVENGRRAAAARWSRR